jgi:hypothetical protein
MLRKCLEWSGAISPVGFGKSWPMTESYVDLGNVSVNRHTATVLSKSLRLSSRTFGSRRARSRLATVSRLWPAAARFSRCLQTPYLPFIIVIFKAKHVLMGTDRRALLIFTLRGLHTKRSFVAIELFYYILF